uniref:Uncharacterized protein n=1 Tax=Glossina brevipalpis TaxID=37001 RepID=A0A1A9W8A1_9MUSC
MKHDGVFMCSLLTTLQLMRVQGNKKNRNIDFSDDHYKYCEQKCLQNVSSFCLLKREEFACHAEMYTKTTTFQVLMSISVAVFIYNSSGALVYCFYLTNQKFFFLTLLRHIYELRKLQTSHTVDPIIYKASSGMREYLMFSYLQNEYNQGRAKGREAIPVDVLYPPHLVYRIKSICILSSDELDTVLITCTRHTGAVKSAGNTIENATQQAAAWSSNQVKSSVGTRHPTRIEKRITDELKISIVFIFCFDYDGSQCIIDLMQGQLNNANELKENEALSAILLILCLSIPAPSRRYLYTVQNTRNTIIG